MTGIAHNLDQAADGFPGCLAGVLGTVVRALWPGFYTRSRQSPGVIPVQLLNARIKLFSF